MSRVNPPFAKNPLITGESARHIAEKKRMSGFGNLFIHLETLLTVKKFSDAEQGNVNMFLNHNNFHSLEALVNRKWKAREVAQFVGKTLKTIFALLFYVYLGVYSLGMSYFIPMLPVVFAWVSRVFGASTCVVVVFTCLGVCVAAALFRYVFQEAFLLFVGMCVSLLEYIWSALAFIGDKIAQCFLMILKGSYRMPTVDDCSAIVCDMTSALLGYGKNFTAAKFVSLAMTVLIALNATHEFVDVDGNRFAIMPKDFANLPTPDAQRIRISRVDMPKPEMPLPNNSFEEKAEFLNEKSRQKAKSDEPEETDKFTWASFGKWAMDVAMQHAVVQVIKYGAQRVYNWFFHAARNERSSLVRVFFGMGAGAVARNLVAVDAPLGNEVVGSVVGVVVYRMLEWVVSKAFDYYDSFFKKDRAQQSAEAAEARASGASNVYSLHGVGNPTAK